MELQKIVLQPHLTGCDYSHHCGVYRYNGVEFPSVLIPNWDARTCVMHFDNRWGRKNSTHVKVENFNQMQRKFKNVGIKTDAHKRLINRLVNRGLLNSRYY